jgi:hypothetical protein
MSDAASSETREGYLTVAYPYQGTVYTFTFYEGFVGRILLRPQGGEQVVVYKQQGVYHVPQPASGELRYADVHSTVKIKGGPAALDIELGVDDGPQEQGRGPIKKIKLRGRKDKNAPKGQDRGSAGGPAVRILRGEDQIASLDMELKTSPSVVRGGVEAFQASGDDEVVVENNAETCPPDCQKP